MLWDPKEETSAVFPSGVWKSLERIIESNNRWQWAPGTHLYLCWADPWSRQLPPFHSWGNRGTEQLTPLGEGQNKNSQWGRLAWDESTAFLSHSVLPTPSQNWKSYSKLKSACGLLLRSLACSPYLDWLSLWEDLNLTRGLRALVLLSSQKPKLPPQQQLFVTEAATLDFVEDCYFQSVTMLFLFETEFITQWKRGTFNADFCL